jgi:hypothetical protein
MKAWKTLALTGLILGFGAAVQAEDATNKLAVNKLAVNKLAVNKLAVNKLAVNKLAVNSVGLGQPGAGAATDIVAIELPNGVRLER